ncbi:alpha-protein kinase 1 [Cheilinus undulatus]|uniref:alpha-protein kinase 1 n=1 Tax=Cheilinus undulatus TaxID=241271 RepID=UPI001BD5AC43|nr:alpha-protein kinase 1 [Cheilinus undulatus]XP_041635384.1 alpha-protein kinase 1 [Cheilinus undulatus]
MASQEVGALLEECFTAAGKLQPSTQPKEEERMKYCSCRDSLCEELASLLQEAIEMKWPFVPEKWQYKKSLLANDKTNLSDLISKHLPQLLAVLKTSIMAHEACTALAVIFLVDRFLYWTDESSRLLKITRLLHIHYPNTPMAPQLVIRQARVYLNSGKLQKAEYILSRLINSSGETGCWVYHSESDQALVQAVSVQVRGMILQKLGLWLEAAELIWASLVGYYALPQPDKKGIGTSLGLLANILVSMNDEDFHSFKTNPDIDLSLLGDRSHRLLSAAQAAKMAVVYSQYTSLYVLTNVATQGTCLLSYSFSVHCPAAQRQSYLLQAKEAFEIGLLTKAEGELVTSKQELHTFLKAAYSLTVTHKWLSTPPEVVVKATQACQKALAAFYNYCQAENQDKDGLCADIMQLVAQVKMLLAVKPFQNSDKRSFIPDSYRNIEDTLVNFTLEGFATVIQRFKKYHASLSETVATNCKRMGDKNDEARLCITAIGTTIGALNTDCNTEACKESKDAPKEVEPQQSGSNASFVYPPTKSDLGTTQESTDDLGSSWQKFSLSGSGSLRPSNNCTGGSAIKHGANGISQSCLPTEVDDDHNNNMQESGDKKGKRDLQGCEYGISSHAVLIPSTSSKSSKESEKFEVIQADAETEDWMSDVDDPLKPSLGEGAVHSLSQLTLRTASSSLGDSFGSQSSWEKISLDPNSPASIKPQTYSLSKAGTGQVSKSPVSDWSIFHSGSGASSQPRPLESHIVDPNMDTEAGPEARASSQPRPLESHVVDPNMGTDADTKSKPAVMNGQAGRIPDRSRLVPEQCASTEKSTESSFEMLDEYQNGHQSSGTITAENVNLHQSENLLCYSCQKQSQRVVPKRQYLLSQQDYVALLAGVCHECLLKRLQSDNTKFKLEEKEYKTAYSALHLKFSRATGLWTARETCIYIGESMKEEGSQRTAIWVQFLHQEERLSSYVGKDYKYPKQIQFHLKDVERQMTAQYYVTEFNKSLYDKEVMAQIFFIPSEALLILNGNEIVGCVTVEPYMLGDFVKLTNNTIKKNKVPEYSQATEYGLAFGHFTYLFSDCKEVVVDLQGWVTANGKGLTYLTDPQIHSTKVPKGPGNYFADRGLKYFLEDQHGPDCNEICQLLELPPVGKQPRVLPQKL